MPDIADAASLGLDTDCLIYLTERSAEGRGQHLIALLAKRADRVVVVSTASLAEFLVGVVRREGEAAATASRNAIRALPGAMLVPLTEEIAVRTARIRAETNLKLPDAIHIASAIEAGAEGFLTNDRELLRAAGVLPVYILDDVIEAGGE